MAKNFFYAISLLACFASCNKGDIPEDGILFTGISHKVHDFIHPDKGITRFDTSYTETVKVLDSKDSIFFIVDYDRIAFEKNMDNNYFKSLQRQGTFINFQLISIDSLKYTYSFTAPVNSLYSIVINFNGKKQ
jgi:hypothetical protein